MQKRQRMETLSGVTSSHTFFTLTVTQIQQHGTRKTPLLIQGDVQCCPKAYKIQHDYSCQESEAEEGNPGSHSE